MHVDDGHVELEDIKTGLGRGEFQKTLEAAQRLAKEETSLRSVKVHAGPSVIVRSHSVV